MNIADPFKQLVERRLWPIALLLVAAIVAMPMLLGSDAEQDAAMPTTAALPAGQGATEPVVSLGDEDRREDVRAVLGLRKDPFRPAQVHPVATPENVITRTGGTASVNTGTDSGSTGSTGTGGTGGGTVSPDPVSTPKPDPTVEPTTPPVVDPPAPPKPTFELYSLQVRFGDIETGQLVTRNVKRLTGLPGGNPAALYLGLTENHAGAVFLIDSEVEVVGDGVCDPAPKDCQTLVLKPGETVFLTRGQRQWELDLIAVNTRRTTDRAEARRSRNEVARGGRQALRRMKSASRYRYSKASGTVREVSAPERGLQGRGAKFTSGG